MSNEKYTINQIFEILRNSDRHEGIKLLYLYHYNKMYSIAFPKKTYVKILYMECYSTQMPKQAFIDIAIDHGLASPDTADKTYRKALQKMKLELIKQEIY